MARQLPITGDQKIATDRQDLQGVVYILSGTLKGRRPGVADATFKWATTTATLVGIGDVEEYIGLPAVIRRGQRFLPGEGSDNPAVKIPVYNLKFGASTSLVSAWDDGDYAFEDSTASLRVGYMKPGETAADINFSGDFTFLVKDGFLGPPEGVDLDGFVLPLYSRGNMRNRKFRQPRNVGEVTLISGAMMKKDVGIPLPVIIGKPDSWFKPPTFDCGVRGFTTSGFAVGATAIEFSLETVGQHELDAAGLSLFSPGNTFFGESVFPLPPGNVLFIDRQKPAYMVQSVDLFDQASGLCKVTLISGLASEAARGSYVQEDPRYREMQEGSTPGNTAPSYAEWIVACHPVLENAQGDSIVTRWQEDLAGNLGWLFPDGTIRLVDPGFWAFETRQKSMAQEATDSRYQPLSGQLNVDILTVIRQARHQTATSTTAPVVAERLIDQSVPGSPPEMYPPTWFDPRGDDPVEVTAQPTFTSNVSLSSKINYPTGGTGVPDSGGTNADARDGNDQTGATMSAGTFITLTFNSISSPFSDTDTTASTLHVIAKDDINFEDSLGSTTFGVVSTGGTIQQYRFTQGSARDYNETVRCEADAGGSGGTVLEVWWEHDLSTTEESTRTQDVELSSEGAGTTNLGPRMQFTDLVMRIPSQRKDVAGQAFLARASTSLQSTDYTETDPDDTFSDFATVGTDGQNYWIAYPTSSMVALQSIYLGAEFGSIKDVNEGVYDVAHQKFTDADIRWGFVLQKPLRDWTILEQELAAQSRAHFYYGPTGHEIVYMDTNADIEASGAIAEFRLPGTPGANSEQPGNGTMIERTRTDEIINTVRAVFNEDYLTNTFQKTAEKSNADSAAIHGERRDPRGDMRFWAHSTFAAHPTYDAAKVASGIVQFYADRGAFALTRFRFDTAWPAFGVERGSAVRVVYPIAPGDKDENYRSVLCEVEDIATKPGGGEVFEITARATGTPARGLPAFRWLDRYLTQTEVWTDRLRDNDAWRDRWST